ncbi:PAS domain-containing protein [Methylobacterium sp. ID0610]|uniref:PAS domain-containing protein n=1 Tax=Methylobacterium carpenticola TaxID=3344827 RepID=UPI003681ECFC
MIRPNDYIPTLVMDALGLSFSSSEFLRMIESHGLTGSWAWAFRADEHYWSPGFFRLLGLEALGVAPSYALFYSLVHPEDQGRMATTAQMMQGGILADYTFRVIRPDRTIRILLSRNEMHLAPDGRPRGASGVVLDVTDRERLVQARKEEQRQRRLVFEETLSFTWAIPRIPVTNHPVELSHLTGLPLEELNAGDYSFKPPEERAGWTELFQARALERKPFDIRPTLILADRSRLRFRVNFVPLFDDAALVGWAGMTTPAEAGLQPASLLMRQGLRQAVLGHHLRAARGLLDWSMTDLAQASGLSLSTIRRLEQEAESPAAPSRQRVIEALRRAGIRFCLLDDGVIAVARA